ncbi:MAG: NOB1 family endonuclease [Candidatus Hodarchaeales archaeon]
MNNIKRETFILDSTAFIRLDFPRLQTIEESTFLTTYSVKEELKDFRSRMNLDSMLHSNRLTLVSPDPNNIKAMTERLKRVDPIRKLSLTDIEILTLTLEENGVLITNDFAIQNAAHQFKIKTQVVSGKKIKYTRKGMLKCTSCNKKFKLQTDSCPDCGGKLKQVYTTKKIEM